MNHSINNLLTTSEMAVINAMHNPQITEALNSFGLQKESLLKGQALIEKAQKLYQSTPESEEEQTLTQLKNSFLKHTKLARIMFVEDETAWNKLGLDGARKQSRQAWIAQAITFYSSLLNDNRLMRSMFRFGIQKDDLIQMMKDIEVFENESKISTVLKESDHRDLAIDELQDWMNSFIDTARQALKQQPHQLKALGMEAYAE